MKLEKRKIKVRANNSKRTYTLRMLDQDGKVYLKYRTSQMSKEEFDSASYWTENDWKQFMKTDEYYKVK